MKTKDLELAEAESAKQAKGMWKIILGLEGPNGASEWLAAHVGRIWEENKDLKRRVRALERKAKQP